jgi:arsenite methyltransferase
MLNVGYERATYSGGLLELIARFVPGRAGITEEEARAWAESLRDMGPGYFFCITRFVFLATF